MELIGGSVASHTEAHARLLARVTELEGAAAELRDALARSQQSERALKELVDGQRGVIERL